MAASHSLDSSHCLPHHGQLADYSTMKMGQYLSSSRVSEANIGILRPCVQLHSRQTHCGSHRLTLMLES